MWRTAASVFVLGKCSLEIKEGGGKLRPCEVESSLFHPISSPSRCQGLVLPPWLDGEVGAGSVDVIL